MKILKFFATWCGPCKQFDPVIKEVAADTGVEIQNVNVDENPELVERHGVKKLPTLVFLRGEEVLETVVGIRAKKDIINVINKYAE